MQSNCIYTLRLTPSPSGRVISSSYARDVAEVESVPSIVIDRNQIVSARIGARRVDDREAALAAGAAQADHAAGGEPGVGVIAEGGVAGWGGLLDALVGDPDVGVRGEGVEGDAEQLAVARAGWGGGAVARADRALGEDGVEVADVAALA